MRPQDLLRLRTSRVTPGEGWDAEGVLASRLQARNIETRAPRALLEECLTRVVSRAEGSQLRAVRVAVETERPAPLLMRLMRKKSTLDAVGRTREVVREAREPRPALPRAGEAWADARAERGEVSATNPVRELPAAWGARPERWGMAASRGGGGAS